MKEKDKECQIKMGKIEEKNGERHRERNDRDREKEREISC